MITLNRLDELLIPRKVDPVVKVLAITRSAVRRHCQPEILQEVIVQQVRLDRILKAQGEEKWIADLKTYLIGDVATLSAEELKFSAIIAPDYDNTVRLLFRAEFLAPDA